MKRGARLAVLAAALAVLVGAWYLAATFSRHQQEVAADAHGETIDISVGPAEQVTAVAWDYFGDAVNLTRSGGSWEEANDETCPIDQTAADALARTVASLQATDRIEDVTDFAQYGLADCAFTVAAGAGDTVNTYEIGNIAANGGQYVRINGEDAVYVETGALAPAFQIALDDVLLLETMPQDIDMVTGLAVQTDAGVYELRYLDDAADVWYTDADPWFLMDADGEAVCPLDTDQVEDLYGLVTDLRLQNCQTWALDDPAQYGLDEPQGTVLLGYVTEDGKEESTVLQFGDYADGDVYVRLEGSEMVYRISGTVLDGLMYPDFDAMAPLHPCALDWDRLESVTIQTEDDTYEIARTVMEPDEADGAAESVYTEGGRSLDADKVERWLRQVYELPADSRAAGGSDRELLFTLTFRQDSAAYPEVTVRFRAYDSAHYLCSVNEEQFYLVSRTAAADVPAQAMEFLKQLPE